MSGSIERFKKSTSASSRYRSLHGLLSSRNRDLYIQGVITLWELYLDQTHIYILERDFLNNLETRLENQVFDNLDEKADEWFEQFSVDEDESSPDAVSPTAPDYVVRARDVYRRMRETGWIIPQREEISGSIVTTLTVPEAASRLAEFVYENEYVCERDETSCLFTTLAVLKESEQRYKQAEKAGDLKTVSSTRELIAADLVQALTFSEERTRMLATRIRRAYHGYKQLCRHIGPVREMDSLLPLMEESYRDDLLRSVVQPLRVDDGYRRYGDQIVNLLDRLRQDGTALSLMTEYLNLRSDRHSVDTFELRGRMLRVRALVDQELRDSWSAIETADADVTEQVKRKVRIVIGGESSTVFELERIMAHLCYEGPDAQKACVRALSGLVSSDVAVNFTRESVYTPRVATPREVKNPIKVKKPMRRKVKNPTKNDLGLVGSAATWMMKHLKESEGYLCSTSMPLESRDDRIFLIAAVLAARREETKFVALPIDDSIRDERGGQSVPVVDFASTSHGKEQA